MSLNSILATTPLTSTNYVLKATGTTIGNSLIWDNGTNVGIGNTNTTYTLDVSGTGRFTGALTAGATTLNGNLEFASGYFINMPWASDTRTMWERYFSATYFQRISSNGTLRQLRLESNGAYGNASIVLDGQSNSTVTTSITSDITYVSGKLGIGASSPVGQLNLWGSTSQYVVLTNTAADGVAGAIEGGIIGQARGYGNNLAQMASILFRNNATTWYKGDITFNTNDTDGTDPALSPTTRMRIYSNGNISIGTNIVDSGFKFYMRSTAGMYLETGSGSGTTSFQINDVTGGTVYFRVRGDGYLQSATTYNNTTASPNYLSISSSGFFERYVASSQRYKEEIKDWDVNGLDIILALRPRTYKYKKEYYNKADVDFLGLIAEEVAEVNTYLADYENEDGTGQVENVRYATIVVPLIKAVQELSKQNEELSNRLIKLESK